MFWFKRAFCKIDFQIKIRLSIVSSLQLIQVKGVGYLREMKNLFEEGVGF